MEDHDVRRFRAQMRSLQRRLRREAHPVYGVSRSALQVLTAVVRCPDAPQPRQIAEELQMTSSNVAAALRELEAAGYVVRRKDSSDARRVSVFATEDGRSVVAGVRSERDTWLGRAVETLLGPDEQRLLLAAGALMQRLAEFEQPVPTAPSEGPAESSTVKNAS
jgi:DNA-binding MarR family transcriptional regulator